MNRENTIEGNRNVATCIKVLQFAPCIYNKNADTKCIVFSFRASLNTFFQFQLHFSNHIIVEKRNISFACKYIYNCNRRAFYSRIYLKHFTQEPLLGELY